MQTPIGPIPRARVAPAAASLAAGRRLASRLSVCLAAGMAVLVPLPPAAAAPKPGVALPPASHPLLGIWTLSIPQLGCSETYHFRGDGTTLVKSAQEISESEFTVDRKPSAKGFYKLQDRIVKDNGKKDCSGEIMKVGTRATNFLRFHPSGARFVMCRDETMAACIGPFERMPSEGI